jgi:hypothetical protein
MGTFLLLNNQYFCRYFNLFLGKKNVGGTPFPEARIQQRAVTVCPPSRITILFTDHFHLEFIFINSFVGAILRVVSSI